jgi:glucose-6-phosphate 1-dehydrogenase
MAEDFGVQGRGAFYDRTGTVRDVIQNHIFQILSNLAMDPPVRNDSESTRDEKVKVLKAIAPIDEKSIVRGQFRGYQSESGVAGGSSTEILVRLRRPPDVYWSQTFGTESHPHANQSGRSYRAWSDCPFAR